MSPDLGQRVAGFVQLADGAQSVDLNKDVWRNQMRSVRSLPLPPRTTIGENLFPLRRFSCGEFCKLFNGRLSCRRSVPLCINLTKKQSGTLRLHLCVRRSADTPKPHPLRLRLRRVMYLCATTVGDEVSLTKVVSSRAPLTLFDCGILRKSFRRVS